MKLTELTDEQLKEAFIQGCTCLFGELKIEREESWVVLTQYIEETEHSLYMSDSGEMSYTSDAESELEQSLPINGVKLVYYLKSQGVDFLEEAGAPLWIGLRTGGATEAQVDNFLIQQGYDLNKLDRDSKLLFEKLQQKD